MSVLLVTRWRRLGVEKIDTCNILKLLLAIEGGNFPIFVVMFPKKVEQEQVAH